MKPKYLVVAAIAFVAYLFGAKAGTKRYDSIVKTATKYWNDPTVKKARKKARKARTKAQKAALKQAKRIGR